MPTFTRFISKRFLGRCSMAYALLSLCAACGDVASPGATIHVSTSSPEFSLGPASEWAVAEFRTANAGSGPIYLARCGDRLMTAVERWDGTRWIQISGDACLDVNDMSLVRLDAGHSRDDIRTIGERGRYRLRLGSARSGSANPVWDATSNAFDVK